MSKVKSLSRRPGSPSATYVGAAEFKATCLELLDRVRESGNEIVVTKHGKPVARVAPCEASTKATGYVGCLPGTVVAFERPFDPVEAEWDVDRAPASKR